MKHIKNLFCILLVFLFSIPFILPKPAAAHASGPPFLQINGQFTKDNPKYTGEVNSDFPIPQEVTPQEKYLVNQPIKFDIDRTKLFMSPDVAETIIFRFRWDARTEVYEEGMNLSHTYTQPGSYLVSIDTKAPDQPDFTLVVSILINVVPNEGYQLPTVSVKNPGKYKTNRNITFKAETTTDPSASVQTYQWQIGSNTITGQESVKHKYTESDFFESLLLAVTDSNGLIATDGYWVSAMRNTIEFWPLDPGAATPGGTTSATFNFFSPYVLGISLITLGALGIIVVSLLSIKDKSAPEIEQYDESKEIKNNIPSKTKK